MLQFKQEEIKELVDPSAGTLKRSLENLMEHIEKDKANGVRTLVFVYFSGHGFKRSGYQNCILNQLGFFNLEKRLMQLSSLAYVVTVYDLSKWVPGPAHDKLMETTEATEE